ncbi:MAG: dehydrogenase [Deltaproteobacteria bacterium]|nr:MAG: dehydrogenase [Deltaproteobacteria bacterium]
MQLVVDDIKIEIEQDGKPELISEAASLLGLDASQISLYLILSRQLDCKNPEQFYFRYILAVEVPESYQNHRHYKLFRPRSYNRPNYGGQALIRPIIVGFGPAGMFAAIELIKNGLKPVIFERGKKVGARTADIERFIKEKKLEPESNIQFGEGGAGTYSDGKIFSRRNRNVSYVSRVLDTLMEFGAPPDLSYREKPHLGTDVLRVIVKNIRNYILEHGGRIYYSSKLTDLIIKNQSAAGVVINGRDEYSASHILLALGHSARDTYAMLDARGLAMVPRQISLGVRIEHPAETINLFRYGHKYQHYRPLGAASYSINFTNRARGTGAYTFCMCPGGVVVNAASEEGRLAVNGMSYSDRALPYSNAAVVVPCRIFHYPDQHPLAGIKLQRQIENGAFKAGGQSWQAPAQSLYNFLGLSRENQLGRETSYPMGLTAARLDDYLPEFITSQLREAFGCWRQQYPLFVSEQAMLIGAETRTSSPVRLLRNKAMESVNIGNIYPIGEGAGYTGGITSSAADGIRAAGAVMK